MKKPKWMTDEEWEAACRHNYNVINAEIDNVPPSMQRGVKFAAGLILIALLLLVVVLIGSVIIDLIRSI